MKKLFFMAAAALAVTLSSCGGAKQVAGGQVSRDTTPFG